MVKDIFDQVTYDFDDLSADGETRNDDQESYTCFGFNRYIAQQVGHACATTLISQADWQIWWVFEQFVPLLDLAKFRVANPTEVEPKRWDYLDVSPRLLRSDEEALTFHRYWCIS